MKIIKQKPFSTTVDVAEILNSNQQEISDHIRQLGLVYKYSRWDPNTLRASETQGNFKFRYVLPTIGYVE